MAISEHRSPHKGKFDPHEFKFLEAYYAHSEGCGTWTKRECTCTKGNAEASAALAGWAPLVAKQKVTKILRHFGDASLSASLNAVGINKPYLALRLREVLERGDHKEVLAAVRLTLAALGEIVDDRSGGVTVNSTAPVMVVVGASKERIAALRSATPQPSREELERLQNERVQSKLARLKQGESFVKRPSSRAHENAYEGRWERQQAQKEVIDVEAPIPVQPSSPSSDD